MSEKKIDLSQVSDGYHAFAELYRERSALTAALARSALAGVGYAYTLQDEQPGFDGYRTVLYIDLPTGQVSWHFSDADAADFLQGIPDAGKPYDGHDTATKYLRVEAFAKGGGW